MAERDGVVVLVGNPRPGSRTTTAARALAARFAAPAETVVIELSELAHELFAPMHPTADEALATVADARVLIVATPVYKASYTGMLKAFLDLFGPVALRGVVAVPLVVSASPLHQFVAETHVRPLLVELGASVPTGPVTLTEAQLADLEGALDAWSTAWGAALAAFTRAPLALGAGATP